MLSLWHETCLKQAVEIWPHRSNKIQFSNYDPCAVQAWHIATQWPCWKKIYENLRNPGFLCCAILSVLWVKYFATPTFFQSLMRLVSRLKAWAQSTLNVSGDPTKSKWKRHPLCENHQISLWQSWHSYEHIRWSVEKCITFFFHHLQLTLHSTFVIPKRYQDLQILTWSMLAKTCHFTGQMNSAWKFSVTPIYNVAFVLM